MTTKERFEAKIYPEPNTGCWIWGGATSGKQGYGSFNLDGKTYYAHRASYLFFVGDIPKGLHVCHSCDVRMCVNPDHLFLGTQLDNIADMVAKGRRIGLVAVKGEGVGTSKLKNHQVSEIRRLKAAGVSSRELAKTYNMEKSSINNIVKRKTWKHL